jgi:hypothetical protein
MSREPGLYWVVLQGQSYIGKWTGAWWILHDEKHRYNDLELEAIWPAQLVLKKYQQMYTQQMAYFNTKQREYLFDNELQPEEAFPEWTSAQQKDFLNTCEPIRRTWERFAASDKKKRKNKHDGKDSRHP